MSEGKGVGWRTWRNVSKPKESPRPKTPLDPNPAQDYFGDLTHHHGWLRTRHASRPQTPVASSELGVDLDRSQNKGSDCTIQQRNPRPAITRYTSLFSNFKETEAEKFEFSEPWTEIAPLFEPTYADNRSVEASIRSHLTTCPGTPLPPQHGPALLRIFHAFRTATNENERLTTLLQDTIQNWQEDQEQWTRDKIGYDAEIRRLELLIAQGTTGMSGLVRARQGSIIDRSRKQRHYASQRHPSAPTDQESHWKDRRVLYHRDLSPGKQMAALSTRIKNGDVDGSENSRFLCAQRKRRSTSPSVHHVASRGETGADAQGDETSILRKIQSQPQLRTGESSHRRFSFDPGEDKLRIPESSRYGLPGQMLSFHRDTLSRSSTDSKFTVVDDKTQSTPQTLTVDTPRPSKIPSPVQTLGRVRRENSTSSLQTVYARSQIGQSFARASILNVTQDESVCSVQSEANSEIGTAVDPSTVGDLAPDGSDELMG